MTDDHAGAPMKRGPKPAAALLRARVVLLLASHVRPEDVAGQTGLALGTVRNIASEHAAELREAAERLKASVVEATVEGASDALAKIRNATPKAADTLIELADDDASDPAAARVRLDAAKAILDRGGVPATSKNETSGPGGGAQVVRHEITLADAVELAKEPKR